MTVTESQGLRRYTAAVSSPLLFAVAVIALWWVVTAAGIVDRLVLPPPAEVATALRELMATDYLWLDLYSTTMNTIIGFVLAAVGGIGLAIATGLSERLKRMLYPFAIALQVTPRIAIAPLIIVWLGFGDSPKIMIAALIAFFPIFVNTLTGILSVDPQAQEMFRSLGASKYRTFTELMLPSSFPLIFAGLKTAMTLALTGAIVGEFISSEDGLGLLIQRFSYQLNMPDAFAVVIILMFVGLVLYFLTALLDRYVVFWQHDALMTAKSRRRARRDEAGNTDRELATSSS